MLAGHMHATVLRAFGPPESLTYETVEPPVAGPGQVRIAVGAAGVHLVDTKLRAGEAMGPFPLPALPAIPGREVAGVVETVGAGVDPSWLGRRVAAHLGMASRGYAELAVREVEELLPIPDGLGDAAAVALIGTGRTTMGVLRVAPPGPDDVVVVPAAAGGMGALLVQAAKHAGATVVGAAGGASKVELVRELGADVAVDYGADGWADEVRATLDGRAATIVYDGVGGAPGRAAFELLGPGGRLVVFGWSAGAPTAYTPMEVVGRGLTVDGAIGPRMAIVPGGVRALQEAALAAAARGEWRPLTTVFPLAEAAAAHAALEGRATTGKVVLVP